MYHILYIHLPCAQSVVLSIKDHLNVDVKMINSNHAVHM